MKKKLIGIKEDGKNGLFFIIYGFIVSWIIPIYYRSLRSRVLWEESLWNLVLIIKYWLWGLEKKICIYYIKSILDLDDDEEKEDLYLKKNWKVKVKKQKKIRRYYHKSNIQSMQLCIKRKRSMLSYLYDLVGGKNIRRFYIHGSSTINPRNIKEIHVETITTIKDEKTGLYYVIEKNLTTHLPRGYLNEKVELYSTKNRRGEKVLVKLYHDELEFKLITKERYEEIQKFYSDDRRVKPKYPIEQMDNNEIYKEYIIRKAKEIGIEINKEDKRNFKLLNYKKENWGEEKEFFIKKIKKYGEINERIREEENSNIIIENIRND